MLLMAVVALAAASVFAHMHHHHQHGSGGELLCSLMIDETAKPSRPVLMPGVDYEALTVRVRRALAENPRVYSNKHFKVNFLSVSAQAQTTIGFAVELLSNNFDINLPASGNITVEVKQENLANPQQLAFASSNTRDGTNYCQIRNTNNQPACGASSLYRVLNSTGCQAGPDISITFSSNAAVSWYYGTDGNPGVSEVDMVTVAMHELSHGLGFASGVSKNGNANTQAGACSPSCSSAFDTYLRRNNGVAWTATGSSGFYTAFFTSNDLFYSLDGTTSSPYMKIDSGSNFTAGTSGSHWAADITTPSQCVTGNPLNPLDPGQVANFPNCNGLMKGAIGRGSSIHVLGGNTVAVFKSMGYQLRTCSNFTDCSTCLTRGCEWCYSDSKCGDRTNGVDTCSNSNQWVRKSSKCSTGNLACANPGLSVPSSVNQVLDPATLSLQCAASTVALALGSMVF